MLAYRIHSMQDEINTFLLHKEDGDAINIENITCYAARIFPTYCIIFDKFRGHIKEYIWFDTSRFKYLSSLYETR